jgi:hypothetical protein
MKNNKMAIIMISAVAALLVILIIWQVLKNAGSFQNTELP